MKLNHLVHGYQREVVGDDWTQYAAFGDSVDGDATWSPFGPPNSANDVSFGYRGELETTAGVFLRARDLDAESGVFVKRDPLPGVMGTPTYTNAYHYADNDPVNKVDPLGLRPGDADVAAPQFDYVESLLSACGEPITRSHRSRTYHQCSGNWHAQQALYAAQDGSVVDLPEVKVCRPGSSSVNPAADADSLAAWADCRADELDSFATDLQSGLNGAFGFSVRMVVGMAPGGSCALAGFDQIWGDGASGGDVAGCLLDAAGVGVAKLVRVGRVGRAGVGRATVRVCRVYRSFSPDTEVVLGNGTTAAISSLEVGDRVWATDPETGEAGPKRVEAVWPHFDDLLELDTSAGPVTTTEDHEIWNVTDHAWQEAQDLDAGDRLLASDGSTVAVEGLDWSTQTYGVAYDLTVADTHTYHVVIDTTDILVHNCNRLSPNQMNQVIYKGNGPRGIVRVDIGKVKGEQTHAVFGPGRGAASLNIDGTWKHGYVELTRAQKKWLRENGWDV